MPSCLNFYSMNNSREKAVKRLPPSRYTCSLGPQRSLAGCRAKIAKAGWSSRWSTKFDWVRGVQAHAAHMAVVEREATEALREGENAVEWRN